MEKNAENDKIYIEKILKYIDLLKEAFEHFGIKKSDDLMDSELAQLTVSQLITNIYETRKNITDETLGILTGFNKLKLAGARNIASHDYENLNFYIVYDICKKLISVTIGEELENELEPECCD